MKTYFRVLSLFVCSLIFNSNFIVADEVAYQVESPSVGSQDFSGSLGMDFDVNSEIIVTQMGVFDSNQDGIVGTTLTAQIWRRDQTLIPDSVLQFTTADPGTLIDGSRFKSLATPLILSPGEYSIVAFGYGASELNGNFGGPLNKSTNDGGGVISFVGSSRFGTAGSFPTSIDTGPVNRYAAGTFMFMAVPEPSAVCSVFLLLAAVSRRRKCTAN